MSDWAGPVPGQNHWLLTDLQPAVFIYCILPLLLRIMLALLRMLSNILINLPFTVSIKDKVCYFLTGLEVLIDFMFQVTSKYCGTPGTFSLSE